MRRTLSTMAATTLLVLAPAVAANAAPKGGSSGSTGSSLTLVNETAPGTAPAYGQTITFDITQNKTSQPYVSVTCSQNGSVVYSQSAGFFATYPWPWQTNYTLSSGSWTGGAASCVARLYYSTGGGKTSTLATLDFAVSA